MKKRGWRIGVDGYFGPASEEEGIMTPVAADPRGDNPAPIVVLATFGGFEIATPFAVRPRNAATGAAIPALDAAAAKLDAFAAAEPGRQLRRQRLEQDRGDDAEDDRDEHRAEPGHEHADAHRERREAERHRGTRGEGPDAAAARCARTGWVTGRPR